MPDWATNGVIALRTSSVRVDNERNPTIDTSAVDDGV